MSKSSVTKPASNRKSSKSSKARGSTEPLANEMSLPSDKLAKAIRGDLLAWYLKHRRTLPWRSDEPVAYHVMVSEAMLQQTQVATAVNYFLRFIDAFPTVQALAKADEQQVLALWQGLGYYRRARGLHAAAKLIVSEHDGVVPDSAAALLKLPGVGRYTAGAIASIAYNRPEPIVDGNVARVLARVFAIDLPTNEPAAVRVLWQIAKQLVSAAKGNEGHFNQAMMELGAIVCTPRSPACLVCPLAVSCQALDKGLVEQLPVKTQRRKPKAVDHHVIAIESAGKWFFEQRPSVGLWSNMWQLPAAQELDLSTQTAEDASNDAQSQNQHHAERLANWLATSRQIKAVVYQNVGSFTHQTTHRTIAFTLWRAKLIGKKTTRSKKAQELQSTAWRKLDDLADLPLSNPQKRMVNMLGEKQCSIAPKR